MILRSESSLSLVVPSASRAAVSASLILLYVIFQHFLLLFPLHVSVFPLSLLVHVAVFPLSLPVHVSAFPLQVSVFPLSLLVHVSAFPLSLPVHASLHVSVSLHPVFVSLHPVTSSSSFALYLPLSSMD